MALAFIGAYSDIWRGSRSTDVSSRTTCAAVTLQDTRSDISQELFKKKKKAVEMVCVH